MLLRILEQHKAYLGYPRHDTELPSLFDIGSWSTQLINWETQWYFFILGYNRALTTGVASKQHNTRPLTRTVYLHVNIYLIKPVQNA